MSDGHKSSGTLPTGVPSPAPDRPHRHQAGRGANRRYSDDRRRSPGAVAKSAQSAQSAESAGIGSLRVLQSATKTTGPGQHWDSGYSRAPDARKRPAGLRHWGSGQWLHAKAHTSFCCRATRPPPGRRTCSCRRCRCGRRGRCQRDGRRRRRRTRRRAPASPGTPPDRHPEAQEAQRSPSSHALRFPQRRWRGGRPCPAEC